MSFEGVEQSSTADDGCAVLIVVHYRDVTFGFEPAFDFEALRGFDVLEVDASEGVRHGSDGMDEAVGVGFVDFDVVTVESREDFEK